MIYLYRTLETDDDGDLLDHGVVSSGPINGWRAAAKIVKARLKRLGFPKASFKLYPLQAPGQDRLGTAFDAGLFKDIGSVLGIRGLVIR